MAVPEHHPLDPAHALAGLGDPPGHLLDARVEQGDAAVGFLEEVDVHRAKRKAAAHEPHTVGYGLHSGGGQLVEGAQGGHA
jgi:hypothetical protein